MKIIQITPGSGDNFYCENCLRDKALARALRAAGEDTLMVPLYLPPLGESPGQEGVAPIFFGGVNVYLQQKTRLFRHTPRFIDRVFDATGLLRWAGKRAGMTSAEDLGETMLSMLAGENGRQRKELDRLVDFLVKNDPPDVILLSNVLLVGLVGELKRRLDCPIVCLLQDEDEFLDELLDEHRGQAEQAIRDRLNDIDAFVAVSEYFGREMRERLRLQAEKMHVIYNGLELDDYAPAEPQDPPAIGYLSRMTPPKGMDTLADAFVVLKSTEAGRSAKLKLAGGQTLADEKYVQSVRQRLAQAGVGGDVEWLGNLAGPEKIEFLRSLTVLSVPAHRREAAATYVLEAWACGVPVVQPDQGVYPELVDGFGGGMLVDHEDVDELAGALGRLLANRAEARQLGQAGREAVQSHFTIDRQAHQMAQLCQTLTAQPETADG